MIPRRPFLFLRHGETDWNKARRLQGVADIPLNAVGVSQSEAAAERLKGLSIGAIVASPKIRALSTAAATAERIGAPIHIDRRLIERGFGAFEGKSVDEFREALGLEPQSPLARAAAPDGETWDDTVARSVAAVGDWLARSDVDGEPLFVAHGGVFAALADALMGALRRSGNAEPFRFSPIGASEWTIDAL